MLLFFVSHSPCVFETGSSFYLCRVSRNERFNIKIKGFSQSQSKFHEGGEILPELSILYLSFEQPRRYI